MKQIVVAVFTEVFPPSFRGGGPARSSEAMVANAPKNTRPVVITADRDIGDTRPLPVERNSWTSRNGVAVYYATLGSARALRRGFGAVRAERPEILHFNSFFNPRLTILPLIMWRLGYWGRPTILIAPRGEFGSSAAGRRATKKRAYMLVFRLLGIHRRTVWHSTAAHETEDILRFWGRNARVVMRENHVLLPAEPMAPSRDPSEVVRFAYMGRIVEHKGLAVALAAVNASNVRLALDVYGTAEDDEYVAHCEDLARRSGPRATISFHGPVLADSVRTVLSRYDALLMPTAGENFGHVIAEALSASCPVIATSFTPWTVTLSSGGGVVRSSAMRLSLPGSALMTDSRRRTATRNGFQSPRTRTCGR
jgi:glycosyltransferase involved in cell wall biosynthesis